jgi:Sugar (and other) transporter
LGPIPWLIVSEMFAGKHVAVAQGISVQANWACNFFIGCVFSLAVAVDCVRSLCCKRWHGRKPLTGFDIYCLFDTI